MGRMGNDREHRGYRERFPMGEGLYYRERERERVGGPRQPTAVSDRDDLIVLAGYGPGSHSLAGALTVEGRMVLSFDSYATALRELPDLDPALVLAGQADEAGDLFHFLTRLSSGAKRAVVLCLADRAEPHLVNRALEHGAHDVVGPPHSAASILLRLHVSRRRVQDRPDLRDHLSRHVSLGRVTVDLMTRQVLDDGRPLTLSGREFELLVRLIQAGGDVVSREDLLQDIWGSDQESEAVLDATVHRLRKKLDEKLREPDLVATVRGIGYRLDARTLEPEPAAAD